MEDYNKPVKIITWDIETSLQTAYMFEMSRKRGGFVGYNNIIDQSHLICACWKELGKRKVNSVSLLDDKKRFSRNTKDDYYVVKKISEAIKEADILVAHNGDKFDLKTLNARLVYHKLPPLPPVLTVDTLKKARQIGQFPSNSLNNLADYLGLGSKISTDFNLWVRAHNGEKKAIKEMTTYCKQDVSLNEKVYIRLRPYMKTHPNIANIGTRNCPKCNSSNIHRHKIRIMSSGRRKLQMHCQDCGSYHTHAELLPEQPLVRV